MITFPNAKINLGLNIVEKRPDGYHNLETVFYPVMHLTDALEVTLLADADDVTTKERQSKMRFAQTGLQIAGEPDDNLVVKAYRMLDAEAGLPAVEINLLKQIPSGAGLGGGSADAAFMLRMLNELFNLKLSIAELEERAARLGADCAFFIQNRPTFAEGIGNLFSPVEADLSTYDIRVVKPDVFVSTREAFALIRPQRPERSIRELICLPVEAWRDALVNDFEASVFPQYPAIGELKADMYRQGAVYAAMSGSGSAVFGLFKK